jgi:hypothetical protein
MNISFQKIKEQIITFLQRFHVIIFTIAVAGGLGIVILMLNNIVVRSGDTSGYTSTTDNASFDEATINSIKKLRLSSEPPIPLNTSGSRGNPFVE